MTRWRAAHAQNCAKAPLRPTRRQCRRGRQRRLVSRHNSRALVRERSHARSSYCPATAARHLGSRDWCADSFARISSTAPGPCGARKRRRARPDEAPLARRLAASARASRATAWSRACCTPTRLAHGLRRARARVVRARSRPRATTRVGSPSAPRRRASAGGTIGARQTTPPRCRDARPSPRRRRRRATPSTSRVEAAVQRARFGAWSSAHETSWTAASVVDNTFGMPGRALARGRARAPTPRASTATSGSRRDAAPRSVRDPDEPKRRRGRQGDGRHAPRADGDTIGERCTRVLATWRPTHAAAARRSPRSSRLAAASARAAPRARTRARGNARRRRGEPRVHLPATRRRRAAPRRRARSRRATRLIPAAQIDAAMKSTRGRRDGLALAGGHRGLRPAPRGCRTPSASVEAATRRRAGGARQRAGRRSRAPAARREAAEAAHAVSRAARAARLSGRVWDPASGCVEVADFATAVPPRPPWQRAARGHRAIAAAVGGHRSERGAVQRRRPARCARRQVPRQGSGATRRSRLAAAAVAAGEPAARPPRATGAAERDADTWPARVSRAALEEGRRAPLATRARAAQSDATERRRAAAPPARACRLAAAGRAAPPSSRARARRLAARRRSRSRSTMKELVTLGGAAARPPPHGRSSRRCDGRRGPVRSALARPRGSRGFARLRPVDDRAGVV